MELKKITQDLKMEVETIKKTQRETTLKIEILGKKSGDIDASISNRIQEIEETISGTEDSIENIGTTIKENTKCKKILTQNIQEIQDTMRRPNLWIIGVDENEDFQLKGPANIFNKTIEAPRVLAGKIWPPLAGTGRCSWGQWRMGLALQALP